MRNGSFIAMLTVVVSGSVDERNLLSSQKEIMLSVWWDIQGIIHYELNNQSLLISKVNNFVVWKQLWIALVNRKGVILYHVCPCTAQLIKELFEELSWEKLLHPQYSPNIASSDYHLFRSLRKYLDVLRLTLREEVEHWGDLTTKLKGFNR